MKRLGTIASFALMLLLVAGWVRSYWTADAFVRDSGTTTRERKLGVGHIRGDAFLYYLGWERPKPLANPPHEWRNDPWSMTLLMRIRAIQPNSRDRWLTDYWLTTDDATNVSLKAIGLPYWLLVLLFALAPWWSLSLKRRRIARRRAAGCCTQCGYDLRGSPEHCPECGSVALPSVTVT